MVEKDSLSWFPVNQSISLSAQLAQKALEMLGDTEQDAEEDEAYVPALAWEDLRSMKKSMMARSSDLTQQLEQLKDAVGSELDRKHGEHIEQQQQQQQQQQGEDAGGFVTPAKAKKAMKLGTAESKKAAKDKKTKPKAGK